MRWTSWWPRFHSGRLCVVGLDVGPDACRLVVLSGASERLDTVSCAERLALPDDWVVDGEVLHPEALGQSLRTYLDVGGHQPTLVYLGLDDTCVSQHFITLVAGLSPDDVAFQLHAELQSMGAGHVSDLCVDYGLDAEPAETGYQRYWVRTVPRRRVATLVRVAQAAGLKAAVVEPRQEALHRTRHPQTLVALPQVSVSLALQCSEAFGLALRAWDEAGVNFLPHRQAHQQAVRRAWLLGVAVCGMGGACLAAGVATVLASVAQSRQLPASAVTASARTFNEAQKAHALITAVHARHEEQDRWLKTRQDLQSHSLQWGRVLSQSAHGVWVASVKQHNAHWIVQGEALTAQHAHQLVVQLKALDIWAQAPELPQLQVMPAMSATGLAVWQFRIEADLKVGG